MTVRGKIEIAVGVLLLAAVVLGTNSYLGHVRDAARLQATIEAQKAIIEQAQKQMQALQDADKQRTAQLTATLDAMRQAVARVQTPQQIAAWIPQQLNTPQPITIQVPSATVQNPAPDAVATIPQSDLPALRDMIENCRECGVKNAALEQDLVSRDQQLELAGRQLSAVAKERDAAVKAAKGGGFWNRTKRAAKWFAVGVVGGVVALCGTGHCH